jgi:glucose/arabinose dehydrogenase
MNRKRKLVVAGVAALAVAVTGGAVAATKATSPRAESRAVVNDAAKQLGVEPSELTAALPKALANRVDAAVESGRLTKAEGDALKARINSGEVPLFGLGHRGGPHFHMHKLKAAADYLGLTQAQLRTQLRDGKTLAQIARDRDKSVDGLVDALVAEATDQLDQAVEDGRITQAQANEMKAGLEERITDFVNNGQLRFRFRGGRGFHSEPGLRSGPASLPAPPLL